MQQIYVFLASVVIMLASISGVIFLQANLKGWLEKHLSKLVSFSAGVFLFISIHLAEESFEIINSLDAVIAISVGIIFFGLLKAFWPEAHHHEGECAEDHHNKPQAIRMMTGDAIHNVADGIVLVGAFMIDLKFGFLATISILIHELLQEISEFFVLRDSGYSTRDALVKNFLISGTILLGVIAGLILAQKEYLLGILLGFSAGSFLYIVVSDLFPYRKLGQGIITALKHVLPFVIGIGFMYLLGTIIGH